MSIQPLFSVFEDGEEALSKIVFEDGDHEEVATLKVEDLQSDAKEALSQFAIALSVTFEEVQGYGSEAIFWIGGEEDYTLHIAEDGEYIRFVHQDEETLYYDCLEFEESDESAHQVLGSIAASFMDVDGE
tara:strand:+ start:132 stop:521 length:390 start_codon:yes stop_codon:yes gene_type:complete